MLDASSTAGSMPPGVDRYGPADGPVRNNAASTANP